MFVAEAFLSPECSPEVAFDALADHPSWNDWMPRSFKSLSKADGPLRPGRKIKMRIVGAPATLEVTVVERAKERSRGAAVFAAYFARSTDSWAGHVKLPKPKTKILLAAIAPDP